MIASFADEKTRRVYQRERSRELPAEIQERARDKLLTLDNATCERDLRALPALQQGPASADWTGPWRLRINERWCLGFAWRDGSAHSVRIVAHAG